MDECHDYSCLGTDSVESIAELCDNLLVGDIISHVTHERVDPCNVWLMPDHEGFEYSQELGPRVHVVSVEH